MEPYPIRTLYTKYNKQHNITAFCCIINKISPISIFSLITSSDSCSYSYFFACSLIYFGHSTVCWVISSTRTRSKESSGTKPLGIAISLSLPHLAIFHLLAHALFKSSLFISIGMIIVSHGHYQDSRVLSRLAPANPAYSAVIIVSVANLMGLPFISGYYSKDQPNQQI